MQTYMNEDASYFDEFDVENAQVVKHPLVDRVQANAQSVKMSEKLLDDDVADWISKQDESTRQAVNSMLRQLMVVKPA